MYEYKFVSVKSKGGLIYVGPKENYQDIITAHAKDGWRFVQVFVPSQDSHGRAGQYDMIFERSTGKS